MILGLFFLFLPPLCFKRDTSPIILGHVWFGLGSLLNFCRLFPGFCFFPFPSSPYETRQPHGSGSGRKSRWRCTGPLPAASGPIPGLAEALRVGAAAPVR